MKKNTIAVFISLVLSLSLAGCSEKTDSGEEIITQTSETSSSESSDSEKDTVSPVVDRNTDYFSRLDETLKSQITLISQHLPELLNDHSYIYLSDLDGNGRTELILSNPDFIIYEISEDGKSLVQTVAINDDIPILYPVTDKLMCADENGTRHYVWRSLRDESGSVVTESEKEYIYENGQLSVRPLRSRQYNFLTGEYSTHTSSEGVPDYAEYASAVSDLFFNSGLHLQQLSMGVLTAEDINHSDENTLIQFLSELRTYFSVTDPLDKFQYSDLDGIWIKKEGFSSGSEYYNETSQNDIRLSIHDNEYDLSGFDQITGNIQYENYPLSFSAGNNYNSLLWHAELADTASIKNAVLFLDSDGVLILEASIPVQNGTDIAVEWKFEKEGWEYTKNQSELSASSETQPVRNPEGYVVSDESYIQDDNASEFPDENSDEIFTEEE